MSLVRPLARTALALGLAAAPAHAAPTSSEVEIPGGAGPLRGTLTAPVAGPGAPAAVLLVGSGPTDRDGNSPLGVRAATHRLLAEGLAARGVTSVRVDKRGMFGSGAAAPDANRVMLTDLAADARAWAADLRARTGAPCAWLVGHSEGTLVALLAAGQADGICGLVLVASPGRKLGDVLRDQLRANPANAPILDQALGAIAELEAGRHVDATTLHPALAPLFHAGVQDFLIGSFAHDPAALLAATELPVLVVQGDTDLQVSVADAERLHNARPGVQLARIPGANHVLKASPADRGANLATYADPDLPLAPGVVDAVADFLTGR